MSIRLSGLLGLMVVGLIGCSDDGRGDDSSTDRDLGPMSGPDAFVAPTGGCHFLPTYPVHGGLDAPAAVDLSGNIHSARHRFDCETGEVTEVEGRVWFLSGLHGYLLAGRNVSGSGFEYQVYERAEEGFVPLSVEPPGNEVFAVDARGRRLVSRDGQIVEVDLEGTVVAEYPGGEAVADDEDCGLYGAQFLASVGNGFLQVSCPDDGVPDSTHIQLAHLLDGSESVLATYEDDWGPSGAGVVILQLVPVTNQTGLVGLFIALGNTRTAANEVRLLDDTGAVLRSHRIGQSGDCVQRRMALVGDRLVVSANGCSVMTDVDGVDSEESETALSWASTVSFAPGEEMASIGVAGAMMAATDEHVFVAVDPRYEQTRVYDGALQPLPEPEPEP